MYGRAVHVEKQCVVQQHVYYADWTQQKYEAVFTVYIVLFCVLAGWLLMHVIAWFKSNLPEDTEE